ncbi:MAG: DUF3667 domain-containing protein [Rikenellaceae bacterium]|nr:DUF3667 domain-containing protein [Rikenellaceae bacterium]
MPLPEEIHGETIPPVIEQQKKKLSRREVMKRVYAERVSLFDRREYGRCKNCDTVLQSAYCPECGQRSDTRRLTFRHCFIDTFSAFLIFDTRCLRTLKMLFIRPGEMMRSYISGNRVSYMNPFTLLFVLAAIYGILYTSYRFAVNGDFLETNLNSVLLDGNWNDVLKNISSFFTHSVALHTIAMIPFYTIFTQVMFKRKIKGYINFTEIMFAVAFISCMKIIVDMVMVPAQVAYDVSKGGGDFVSNSWTWLLYLLITAWCYKGLFHVKFLNAFVKSFLILIFSLISAILIGIILFFCFYCLVANNSSETINEIINEIKHDI